MPRIARSAVEMIILKETREIKTEKRKPEQNLAAPLLPTHSIYLSPKTFLPPSLRAPLHLPQNLQNHPATKHFILHIHHKRLPFCHPIDGLF